jgi:hypothetical protein
MIEIIRNEVKMNDQEWVVIEPNPKCQHLFENAIEEGMTPKLLRITVLNSNQQVIGTAETCNFIMLKLATTENGSPKNLYNHTKNNFIP